MVVISAPSTFRSPSKSTTSFATVIVPPEAPILMVAAAPNALTVVAVELARLKVVVDTVRSPPSIFTSPSTSRSLLTLVVPVAAPISTVVAAPKALTVVALVLRRLKDV